ncbi:hypothetical protein J8273_5038 [Carpediemonas membranifera]|uniref:Uncharacterized protein n=1 Tax=Carpediemonas membranifera TaxID=201153 RepID=A0A8J6E1W0_9EUKA|nr:hypothetical protein J8273_5038 [Carpediemonas membranifera]|eukprot:KAG9393551.1 hypothetical protein J8273_5038 [Carpediemonas membranifera]
MSERRADKRNPYTDESFASLDMPTLVDSLIVKAYDRAKEFVRQRPNEIIEEVSEREEALMDEIERLKKSNLYLEGIVRVKNDEIAELVEIIRSISQEDD